MNINIITIGTKMSDWVNTGYFDYANRLKSYCKLNLITLPLATRSQNTNPQVSKKIEGEMILDKLAENDYVIALDSKGKQFTSEDFAQYLNKLKLIAKNINILIGGPDGLSKECLLRADDKISLSNFTLPHPLVRIVLAEQLFRGFAILNNHPYHK